MKIDHVALWADDLQRSIDFYQKYFAASPGAKYVNRSKGFESVFLSFSTGARLEVMTTTTLSPARLDAGAQRMGLTHLAIAVGSDILVDELTAQIRAGGYPVLDGPRRTGDGYYESVVLDPDGNRVEITA